MNKSDIKVLIVDDEPIVADSVECFLEDRDWNVNVVNSAEIALMEKLEDKSINICIVDIRLGGMSGEEFIRKAHAMNKDLKFLICTGSPNYLIDDSLHQIPALYGTVFKKPINDLMTLDAALMDILDNWQ